MKREVLSLAILSLSLGAQVRFDVPRLGYVYDPEAKAIRQVSGVPGAAAFENSIDGGGAIERAWISQRGFAVVQGKLDSGTRLLDWSRGSSQSLIDVETAGISNSGRFAALAKAGTVEVWDGTAATRTARFDGAANDIKGIAVSDDGNAVLIAAGSRLQLWNGRGSVQTVWSGDTIRDAGFFGESTDFAALDAGTGKLYVSRAGSITESESPLTGATSMATLGASRLVLAGYTTIAVLDLTTSSLQAVPTDTPIESFTRVGYGGDLFQIRFKQDQRTALFETAPDGSPQIEFLVGGVR